MTFEAYRILYHTSSELGHSCAGAVSPSDSGVQFDACGYYSGTHRVLDLVRPQFIIRHSADANGERTANQPADSHINSEVKMRRHSHWLFYWLAAFCFFGHAQAQPWSGILNPTRAGNWQRASVGVAGGIPTTWTQCGSTIAAYTGTAATINNALASCNGQNKYVLLGPGTFNLTSSPGSSPGSPLNHVILRGSGPNSTKIIVTGGGTSCSGGRTADVCFYGPPTFPGSASTMPPCGGSGSTQCADWTGGYSRGTTSITVANVGASAISNGDWIVLDQASDQSDTGGFIISDLPLTPGTTTGFIAHQNLEQPTASGRRIGGIDYEQNQYVQVTAGCASPCSGKGPFTLTITPGLYANNWASAGRGVGLFFLKPTSYLGIENLTVDATTSTSTGAVIGMVNCANCWAKNVRTINSQRSHVWVQFSPRSEVRDSYFFGTKGGVSQSYGIEFGEPSGCDSLFENNIFQQVAGPVVGGGGCGVVVGYNFAINDVYSPSSYMQPPYLSHDTANDFNLWEGNQFPGLFCDDIHGTPGGVDTLFRNRLNGRDWNQGAQPTQQTNSISLMSYCRGYNIIGNVLGTPGYHKYYEQFPPGAVSSANCNLSIFDLGRGGGICGNLDSGLVLDDVLVRNTMMRWGNYDTVNAAVRWDATESSPPASTYIAAQSTPASHTLPSSFYLSGKPSWWGSAPYPAVGPDVTGGTGPGGYAYDIPAKKCYDSLGGPSDGSGSVLSFDANACYAPAAGPAPPTNNTAAGQ